MDNTSVDKLKEKFSEEIIEAKEFRNETTIFVKKDKIVDVMKFLHNDEALSYDFLVDVTCVDYLPMEYDYRFTVVYHLYSFKHNKRLRVKAPITERDCSIDSVTSIWKTANWLEREVFDLYGIKFNEHPDLRRILMPPGYEGHPLRKDYPLEGRGERDDLATLQRISGQDVYTD